MTEKKSTKEQFQEWIAGRLGENEPKEKPLSLPGDIVPRSAKKSFIRVFNETWGTEEGEEE